MGCFTATQPGYLEPMGAPEHVPTSATEHVRKYSSPPRRAGEWRANRPGELSGPQPVGDGLGTPGPDQGYALRLAKRFRGQLKLKPDEAEADALAGASAIAMKRSGLLGRAPILHDIEAGLVVWGFLDATADPELVRIRRVWFEGVHSEHHYQQRRRIVDAVPADLLKQSSDDIGVAYVEGWADCLDLNA